MNAEVDWTQGHGWENRWVDLKARLKEEGGESGVRKLEVSLEMPFSRP